MGHLSNKTISNYGLICEQYDFEKSKIRLEKEVQDFLRVLPNSTVLDLGCGPGRDLIHFSESKINEKQDMVPIGIDITVGMLKLAHEKGAKNIGQMDMRALAFKDEIFDGIWACASLVHLDRNELKKTLKEIYRVLKKGGTFFAMIKEGKEKGHDYFYCLPRDFYYYELNEFDDLLKETGLQYSGHSRKEGNSSEWNWLTIKAKKP